MGYLKKDLSAEDKQELLALIEDYRNEIVPLIAPLTLLQHHLNCYPVPDWVHQQDYLNPCPEVRMLRNHMWIPWGLACCLTQQRPCGTMISTQSDLDLQLFGGRLVTTDLALAVARP